MEVEQFLSIIFKLKRGGTQKAIESIANNSVIFKPKIQVRGVFQSENK